MVLPLRIFSYFIAEKFCSGKTVLNQRLISVIEDSNYILPGDVLNLDCKDTISLLMPSYYSVIQKKYWDVAIFGYWQFKKIPFFLLASPTLGFVFYGAFKLLTQILNIKSFHQISIKLYVLLPFMFHSLFIAVAGLLIYNVEVSTRLLYSSSPYIYIVLAEIISKQTERILTLNDLFKQPLSSVFTYAKHSLKHKLMLCYLLGYFFIGTAMHVKWLPFV